MSKERLRQSIPALKVRQWLPAWDDFEYDAAAAQAKPEPYFYLFSLPARDLKRLTGVYRRSTRGGTPRAKDPNVQRGHEEKRSQTIAEFVRSGFPWCDMGEAKRKVTGAENLRKPGWLPTAILVNILEPGAERNGTTISDTDRISLEDTDGLPRVVLPKGFDGRNWVPENVYPLEVIDGQHRLWAFEDLDLGQDFELPVVAFHGLDRSWQAYLFWSVNITPKKINRSLAYDLYPLLRREDWLDKFAGHAIYRETRSQELVESLWGHPDSPWYQRINMLGETASQRDSNAPMVSQAAWVRSLMASFVKEWVASGTKPGGLFGAPRSAHETFLPWNRAMQAAFLITAWKRMQDEVAKSKAEWAEKLRAIDEPALFESPDDAFYGKYSLITTDQGVRGFLTVINDLCSISQDNLALTDWRWESVERTSRKEVTATDEQAVSAAITSLDNEPVAKFLSQIGRTLATFDWRTSSAPDLTPAKRRDQGVFRGSSGYKELRIQLLDHLVKSGPQPVSQAASTVTEGA